LIDFLFPATSFCRSCDSLPSHLLIWRGPLVFFFLSPQNPVRCRSLVLGLAPLPGRAFFLPPNFFLFPCWYRFSALSRFFPLFVLCTHSSRSSAVVFPHWIDPGFPVLQQHNVNHLPCVLIFCPPVAPPFGRFLILKFQLPPAVPASGPCAPFLMCVPPEVQSCAFSPPLRIVPRSPSGFSFGFPLWTPAAAQPVVGSPPFC